MWITFIEFCDSMIMQITIMLKKDSKSSTCSLFHVFAGSIYSLGLLNYLSSCLLTYLLVSGITSFLVVYLFDLFVNC